MSNGGMAKMTALTSKWDGRFISLAFHVAAWSKDPSTKVGCVLVNPKRQVIGMGYNGFPRGVLDGRDRYENRERKYLMVQHAEANAVLNAVQSLDGCAAYVTHHPCANCAGLLIQAGVEQVITVRPEAGLAERFKDSFSISKAMLDEAGVNLRFHGE